MSETSVNQQIEGLLNEEDENAMEGKYLTFRLNTEYYGLPIEHVTEIIGVQKITRVPDMAPFVKGVINLRGQVIPVIDVRLRFDLEPREYDDRTCVVVTHLRGIAIGLIVDSVDEVREIDSGIIVSAPSVAASRSANFIEGIAQLSDGTVVIVLDLDRFLYSGSENEDAEE